MSPKKPDWDDLPPIDGAGEEAGYPHAETIHQGTSRPIMEVDAFEVFDPKMGARLRKEGRDLAWAAEDEHWKILALAELRHVAEHQPRLTADDVREALEGEEPHSPAIWGALFNQAQNRRWISATNQVANSARKERHAGAQRIWVSLLYKGGTDGGTDDIHRAGEKCPATDPGGRQGDPRREDQEPGSGRRDRPGGVASTVRRRTGDGRSVPGRDLRRPRQAGQEPAGSRYEQRSLDLGGRAVPAVHNRGGSGVPVSRQGAGSGHAFADVEGGRWVVRGQWHVRPDAAHCQIRAHQNAGLWLHADGRMICLRCHPPPSDQQNLILPWSQ